MEKLTAFVQEHISDDTTRLILDRAKWPDINIETAVACIESRRKLRNKVQEWYTHPELVFPVRLSAEQCSSTATGRYKAELAGRIASERDGFRLADLTGGLGVDSWFFSLKAVEVLYNEMQEQLCMAARHNFARLGADNIMVSNCMADLSTISGLLEPFCPDIVYLDPARRGEGGRKVFLIEECTPDVLNLKDLIFKHSKHILLKLSPMADITMVCNRLGKSCREVHVVSSGGECKELLVWMDKEWEGEYRIIAAELPSDYPTSEPALFTFLPSEEKAAPATLWKPETDCPDVLEAYLFEPGKALMKSGCFNMISTSLGMQKLGRSTHYYIIRERERADELKPYGKIFHIISCSPLDKRTVKYAGKSFPHSEVTARNIPMDTDTLRRKLGVTSGDDAHIFGLKSDHAGNLLLITKAL